MWDKIFSAEILPHVGKYFRDQTITFMEVLKNPNVFLMNKNMYDYETLINALKFVLFTCFLVLLLRMPLYIVFLKLDMLNTSNLIIIFTTLVVSIVIFIICFHVSSKIMFGHGRLIQSVVGCAYLTAFMPFLALINYFAFASPLLRSQLTGGAVSQVIHIDLVAIAITYLYFIYLVIKCVPVIKYVHKIGTVRSSVASILALSMTMAMWQLALVPLFLEFVQSRR